MTHNSNEIMEITYADIFRYYLGWKDTDEKIIKGIAEGNLNDFYKYLKIMKIVRNLKKNNYPDIYEFSLNYFNENPKNFDVEEFSNLLFQNNFLSGKNKKVIVAASKILWAFNKKTIIMDSRTKDCLQTITGKKIQNYKEFCIYWEEQYQIFKPKFEKLVKELEIDKKISEFNRDWFIRRTFDTYLWKRGKYK